MQRGDPRDPRPQHHGAARGTPVLGGVDGAVVLGAGDREPGNDPDRRDDHGHLRPLEPALGRILIVTRSHILVVAHA